MGFFDHDFKKLGKRPEDRAKPKLQFGHHLSVVPDHPLVDAKPTGINFPMDKNDAAGDCVVAGTHHALQVIFKLLKVDWPGWTLDQVLELYRTQNPGMTSWDMAGTNADGGMYVAQFLAWLVKNGEKYGLTGKTRLLGFAKIDHADHEQMRAAVYLGLAIVTGADLQVAQQVTKYWTYVAGSPEWGGHCVAQDGYDRNSMPTISWGEDDYEVDDTFIVNLMDEAYILLTQAHVDNPDFRNHFDLYSYSQAWQAMTERDFPIHVDPPPAPPAPPTPPEPPQPQLDPPFPGAADDVTVHITHSARRARMTITEWLNHHFIHYFN